MKRYKKLILNKCEIEDCSETENLQLHHIIERTEEGSSHDPQNLAILCANHHGANHSGKLKIIGPYPSTVPPNGRTLVYVLDGVPNIPGIDKPYLPAKPKSYKVY